MIEDKNPSDYYIAVIIFVLVGLGGAYWVEHEAKIEKEKTYRQCIELYTPAECDSITGKK